MNKSILIFSFLIVLAITTAWQFPTQLSKDTHPSIQEENAIICPENVMTIVQRSCFDCHSSASSNFLAKGKLNFSEWEGYTAAKKISKMEKICAEITENKMPKKKYLKKHPESALSAKEISVICEWTVTETKKLFGE